MRNDVLPVRHARRCHGHADDFAIIGAVGIGEDDKVLIQVLDVVFVLALTGSNQGRLGIKVIHRQEAHFARLMVVGFDQQILAALRFRHLDEKCRIALAVDDPVVCLRCAKHMAGHGKRPVVVVHHGVEKAGAIACPDHAASGVLHRVRQRLTGRKRFDADGVVF